MVFNDRTFTLRRSRWLTTASSTTRVTWVRGAVTTWRRSTLSPDRTTSRPTSTGHSISPTPRTSPSSWNRRRVSNEGHCKEVHQLFYDHNCKTITWWYGILVQLFFDNLKIPTSTINSHLQHELKPFSLKFLGGMAALGRSFLHILWDNWMLRIGP